MMSLDKAISILKNQGFTQAGSEEIIRSFNREGMIVLDYDQAVKDGFAVSAPAEVNEVAAAPDVPPTRSMHISITAIVELGDWSKEEGVYNAMSSAHRDLALIGGVDVSFNVNRFDTIA